MRIAKKIAPAAVMVTATMIGGAAFVSADSTSATDSSSSQSSSQNQQDPSKKDGGKITTDATVVAAVTQSVQAKTSGATIDRIAQLPDGSYLAFTVQNGSKVIESLDTSYGITASKSVPADAPSGPSLSPDKTE